MDTEWLLVEMQHTRGYPEDPAFVRCFALVPFSRPKPPPLGPSLPEHVFPLAQYVTFLTRAADATAQPAAHIHVLWVLFALPIFCPIGALCVRVDTLPWTCHVIVVSEVTLVHPDGRGPLDSADDGAALVGG